jgi:hypothetical protein
MLLCHSLSHGWLNSARPGLTTTGDDPTDLVVGRLLTEAGVVGWRDAARAADEPLTDRWSTASALLALKFRFVISYSQLGNRHQVGTPGRIPHGIATELFHHAERRYRDRRGRGSMGLEGSCGGT